MSVTTTKGYSPMEMKKRVTISSKRQLTIPKKFFSTLGFDTEAECIVRGNELIIRPIKSNASGEFAEQILEDLIRQGYRDDELLERFKAAQREIRPAVEAALVKAEQAARGETEYFSYEDVFSPEDEK